jgi:filamentous hemagglutinin family protein
MLIAGLLFAFSCSVAMAQTPPITSSGLNTTVVTNTIITPGGGPTQTQFNITGGTRSSGGTNLFHSFGEFNVPTNTAANFLNNTGLATSNILGRVTGGSLSSIYGTIQTTGFGNANLFLMNPAGFLFGPNARVNVGGMVSFTSADYLRLADGARFNAIPNASADAILGAAPVAAFGFLGSNPGAITVQGSQLTVAEGTGISLVGGNITVQGGTLTAPSGQVNLVSVGSPSKPSGEVVIAGSVQGPGYNPTGFRTLGAIALTQGSTVDVSNRIEFPATQVAGSVVIRGGQFVMDNSSITTITSGFFPGVDGGNVEVTADQVALSNGSSIDASTLGNFAAGNITFNTNTFSATDSSIDVSLSDSGVSGAITIQGLQGSGTYAHAVSLENTQVRTVSPLLGVGGSITIWGDNISLSNTSLNANAYGGRGSITLLSRVSLGIQDSELTVVGFGFGGTVDLRAGSSLNVRGTSIDARSIDAGGGSITMAAPSISLRSSTVNANGVFDPGGTISLMGTKAVSLTNGTVLSAGSIGNAGTIVIHGGSKFTSQDSTISAQSSFGNGGTIHVDASKVHLTNSQLNTSASGGAQSVGGSITMNAKKTILTNSQILSTATEGQGGTITITSPRFHPDASSAIDASSQSGTDGTVTINGVIQP